MGMSVKEAVKKMGCEERECPYLDPIGIKSFCTVLLTDEFCKTKNKEIRKKEIEEFYSLSKKYGFLRM